MSPSRNSPTADMEDKAQKIAALRDLAIEEMNILGKEKQEIVKKIRTERDQQRIKKLKEELGLNKETQ